MAAKAETDLLRFLDIDSQRTLAPAAAPQAVPALDATAIEELRELLARDPERALAAAPARLGSAPTLGEGLHLLNAAEAALATAPQTLAALASNRPDEPYELPEKYRFKGYKPVIPIYPGMKQFETAADAPAWAVTAAAAWLFRLRTEKPTLPGPSGDAVYELQERNGTTTVGLFSDWGTGYYHSAYIARHLVTLDCAQAIHLGDVYYTGTQPQFDKQVRPMLEPVLRHMPLYAMNANHEMDSHGIPYLDYLREKRQLGTGFHPQPQEISYFCLRNAHHQIVAIDTAFYENGRYQDDVLVEWLRRRLQEGRDANLATILLSQNEPYGPGLFNSVAARTTSKLLADLAQFVKEQLIHIWFWGDEHYAALYDSTDRLPFIGSCIGHGGYPFGKKIKDGREGDIVPLLWAEIGRRFPKDTGLRPDRGLNGFCVLTLLEREVQVHFVDWLLRTRCRAVVQRENGRYRVTSLSDERD